jgi:hypothetical protein
MTQKMNAINKKILAFSMACSIIILLSLILYSWFLSSPLSLNSTFDFLFVHITTFYWFALAGLLILLYLSNTIWKNRNLQWGISIAIVFAMLSLRYFYYYLPGSDSNYFRGLTEYFSQSGHLDSSNPAHYYFQWPGFFILNELLTSLTGLSSKYCEFLLFSIFTGLIVSFIYVYASRLTENATIAVIFFFIMGFYFINLQWAPFTLAFVLLLALFNISTLAHHKVSSTFIILLIFEAVCLSHFYVPIFFIIYLLFLYLKGKDTWHLRLTLLVVSVYVANLLLFLQPVFLFSKILPELSKFLDYQGGDYGSIVGQVTKVLINQPSIDFIAQNVSRIVTVTAICLCITGFLLLIKKRRLKNIDYAIFLTGIAYAVLGFVFSFQGDRAIQILLIPLSIGACIFYSSKFRKYFQGFFLIILVLFIFLPIHGYSDLAINGRLQYQSFESHQTSNFLVSYYNWNVGSLILSSTPDRLYLNTRTGSTAVTFESDDSPQFPRAPDEYNCIYYSVGLAKNLITTNSSIGTEANNVRFNIIYNDGLSYIALRNP